MAGILGLRGTGQFTVTGQRPENYREKVLELFPNGSAPLTAMLSMLGSEETDDPTFHIYEKRIPSQRLRINNGAGYTDAETAFTVDADSQGGTTPVSGALRVRKGTVLWVERTGEKMYVSANPTVDTGIACTRAFGTTAAAAILNDDWMTIIGNAHEEGSALPSGIQHDPSELNNYCQIFRMPLEVTETAKNTHFRTGNAYLNAKKDALQDISIQREMAYLFGEFKLSSGTKGKPMRQTRGAISYLTDASIGNSQNVVSAIGALSEQAWFGYLEQVFRYGSQNKLALCGSGALLILENMAKGGNITMRDVPTSETYGMKLMTMRCTAGELALKSHPLFNMHPVLRNNILILDTKHVKERIMKGRDLKFLKNRQTPGDDMVADEFLIEAGLEMSFHEAHMYMTGITSFAP